MLKKASLWVCLSALAMAEEARTPVAPISPPPPPPPAVSSSPGGADAVAAPTAAANNVEPPKTTENVEGVSQRYFGVHVALNLGLFAIDGMSNRFYGFFAGNIGVPLVTDGNFGALTAGLAYNIAISRVSESMWFMDFMGFVPFGWRKDCSSCNALGYGGAGIGVGFRFLHRSGFTMGFKIPVFGFAVGGQAGQFSGAQSVGLFYLASAAALPIISFGFRF